jgi:hypothetical protein
MLLVVLRNSYAWLRAGRRPKQKRLALRSGALKSFGVECSDWIEAHGAQRRDITGGERNSGKYKRDAGEDGQIGRRHAVEQSGHEVRDDERTGHTEPGPSSGQTESPPQDHLEDIASLRSQREANSDLTSLFIHNVGNPLCVRALAGSFPLTA